MHSGGRIAFNGMVMGIPESPKDTSLAKTTNNGAIQSKRTGVGLIFQLLATVYAVIALLIMLRRYSATQQHPEFIWLFIVFSASFYIVFYNALSVEQALKRWLARHFPTLRVLSVIIPVMLATLPIGALYLARFDGAKSAPSLPSPKTGIVAMSSASAGPKAEALKTAHPPAIAAEFVHPITLSDVQYRSGPSATTVTIDVDENVQYEINRLTNPDRIYLDFRGSKLGSHLRQKFQVADPVLRAIRIAEHKGNISRVTLETNRFCDYLLTTVAKSHKLQIELLDPPPSRSSDSSSLALGKLASNEDSSTSGAPASK